MSMCSQGKSKELSCAKLSGGGSDDRRSRGKRTTIPRSSSLPHIAIKETPKNEEECVPTEILVVHDHQSGNVAAFSSSFDAGRRYRSKAGRRWSGDGDNRRSSLSRNNSVRSGRSSRSGTRREGCASRRTSMATGPSLDDVFSKMGSRGGSVGTSTSRRHRVPRRASLTHVRAVEPPNPPKMTPERPLRITRRNSLTHVPVKEPCSYRPFVRSEDSSDVRVHRVMSPNTQTSEPTNLENKSEVQTIVSSKQGSLDVQCSADEKHAQSSATGETTSCASSDDGSSSSASQDVKLFSAEASSDDTSTASSSTHSLVLMNAEEDETEAPLDNDVSVPV